MGNSKVGQFWLQNYQYGIGYNLAQKGNEVTPMDADYKHPNFPTKTKEEQVRIERAFDNRNNVGRPGSEYAQMSKIHRPMVQPLRSIGDWSLGLEEENIEDSIKNAYENLIDNAKDF